MSRIATKATQSDIWFSWLKLPPIPSRPQRFGSRFWTLPSHTIPTKWTLYRRLLRTCPNDDFRNRCRTVWRKQRYCHNIKAAAEFIEHEEDILNRFKSLKQKNSSYTSDKKLAELQNDWMKYYSSKITSDAAKSVIQDLHIPRPKPYLQGISGLINPRIQEENQSRRLSHIIYLRRKNFHRLDYKKTQLYGWKDLLLVEHLFEMHLGVESDPEYFESLSNAIDKLEKRQLPYKERLNRKPSEETLQKLNEIVQQKEKLTAHSLKTKGHIGFVTYRS